MWRALGPVGGGSDFVAEARQPADSCRPRNRKPPLVENDDNVPGPTAQEAPDAEFNRHALRAPGTRALKRRSRPMEVEGMIGSSVW